MAPVMEAILAGLVVGFINRWLSRMEHQCPETRVDRDDSDISTASSGTEVPHLL